MTYFIAVDPGCNDFSSVQLWENTPHGPTLLSEGNDLKTFLLQLEKQIVEITKINPEELLKCNVQTAK